jgi:N-acyl-phosphatidylethanolamine-hydrolysing phospholipase D
MRIPPVKHIRKILFTAILLTVTGCFMFPSRSKNVHYDATKKHHTPEGFRNNYAHDEKASFFKWRWERLTQNTLAKPPAGGWASVLPSVKPDITFLQKNRTERTLTWLGHSTMLLQTNGLNIITDPVFSSRTSPVTFAGPKRLAPLMMSVEDLPDIDIVLVSHNHYDHLDHGTIKAFAKRFPQAHYLVPLGLKPWFADLGITQVRELDWWDQERRGAATFTFVPTQHWSTRAFTPKDSSLWGGFVLEVPRTPSPSTPPHLGDIWRFIYTGDTGYSQDFKDIGAKFPSGFDWAAIPIGAYEPRWFMKAQHCNPEEAVQIMLDLGAKRALGVHWGTWQLSDEALDQPPKDLSAALPKHDLAPDRFVVFQNGETRKL